MSLALSWTSFWFSVASDEYDPGPIRGGDPQQHSSRVSEREKRVHRDAAWVQGIGEGDAAAFSDVFHEYYGQLCAFVQSIVHDPDIAEDLVDDLFTNLWIQHETLDIKVSLASYLYRSARNSAINYIRNHKTRSALETRWLHSDTERHPELPSTLIERQELAVVIEELIAQLPERRREVVLLRWKAGMSLAEIAEVLGIAVQSVSNLLNRALQDLRRRLPQDFA